MFDHFLRLQDNSRFFLCNHFLARESLRLTRFSLSNYVHLSRWILEFIHSDIKQSLTDLAYRKLLLLLLWYVCDDCELWIHKDAIVHYIDLFDLFH